MLQVLSFPSSLIFIPLPPVTGAPGIIGQSDRTQEGGDI